MQPLAYVGVASGKFKEVYKYSMDKPLCMFHEWNYRDINHKLYMATLPPQKENSFWKVGDVFQLMPQDG